MFGSMESIPEADAEEWNDYSSYTNTPNKDNSGGRRRRNSEFSWSSLGFNSTMTSDASSSSTSSSSTSSTTSSSSSSSSSSNTATDLSFEERKKQWRKKWKIDTIKEYNNKHIKKPITNNNNNNNNKTTATKNNIQKMKIIKENPSRRRRSSTKWHDYKSSEEEDSSDDDDNDGPIRNEKMEQFADEYDTHEEDVVARKRGLGIGRRKSRKGSRKKGGGGGPLVQSLSSASSSASSPSSSSSSSTSTGSPGSSSSSSSSSSTTTKSSKRGVPAKGGGVREKKTNRTTGLDDDDNDSSDDDSSDSSSSSSSGSGSSDDDDDDLRELLKPTKRVQEIFDQYPKGDGTITSFNDDDDCMNSILSGAGGNDHDHDHKHVEGSDGGGGGEDHPPLYYLGKTNSDDIVDIGSSDPFAETNSDDIVDIGSSDPFAKPSAAALSEPAAANSSPTVTDEDEDDELLLRKLELPDKSDFKTHDEWLMSALQVTYEAGQKSMQRQTKVQIDKSLQSHQTKLEESYDVKLQDERFWYKARIATLEATSDQRFVPLEEKMIELAPLIAMEPSRLVENPFNNNGMGGGSMESSMGGGGTRRRSSIHKRTKRQTTMQMKQLTGDTFNFLLTAPLWSKPFFLGLTVFGVQMTVYILVAINLIDVNDKNNPLKVPPNVVPEVRLIQFLAIVISVTLQDDLVNVMNLLKDGYTTRFQDAFEYVTSLKFTIVSILRCMVGCLSLLVMFLLIVSSTTVIDILLNFTAVHFISGLDELFFYLSTYGIMGTSCATEAQIIQQTTYAAGAGHSHWQLKMALLGTLLIILLSSMGVIVYQQNSAKFLCHTVHVQFGDELDHTMGALSGLYDKEAKDARGNTRVVYLERNFGRAKFAYCTDLQAWTYTFIPKHVDEVDVDKSDPCLHWRARSSTTTTFDLTETASTTWYIRDKDGRVVVLNPFHLACADCGDCTGRGVCSNAICACDEGWFGLQCEFRMPCPLLATDARFGEFPILRETASQLQLLEDKDGLVTTYNRPIYVAPAADAYELIFFIGRRWVLTHDALMPGLWNRQNETNFLANYFRHEFHAYYSDFSIELISEPRDIGTQDDSPTPEELRWYFVGPSAPDHQRLNPPRSDSADTVVLCATCSDPRQGGVPCFYDGVCNNGTCLCHDGSSGSLCEVPPIGNGRCDEYFNTADYAWDGGDCCEATCISSSQNICGVGDNAYVSKGFFSCVPDGKWHDYPLEGVADSYSGFDLDVSFRSIAVTGLLYDRVVIYQKDGSSWSVRDVIVGKPGSEFGSRVALSTGQYNAVSNPTFLPPLTVAVLDGLSVLRIYKCTLEGCTLLHELPQVALFDLSDDGMVLVTTVVNYVGLPNLISVYESVDGSFKVRAVLNFATGNTIFGIISLAQSGDGSTMVLHKQLIGSEGDTFVSRGETFEIYLWNGSSYEVESSINYKAGFNAYAYEFSLGMSYDGSVFAFGIQSCAFRELRVLQRDPNNNNNRWVSRYELPIDDLVDCIDTRRPIRNNNLGINHDGSMIAFRLGSMVSVFKWENAEWNRIGEDIPLKHYPVAMSSDGSLLVVGSPEEGRGGVTTIYSLPIERSTCSSLLRVSLTLDMDPGALFWTLKNSQSNEILYKQGPYPDEYAFATIAEEICLEAAESSCYEFTISNLRNGGLQLPGQYALFLNGKDIGHRTFDGLFETVYFGKCGEEEGPTNTGSSGGPGGTPPAGLTRPPGGNTNDGPNGPPPGGGGT